MKIKACYRDKTWSELCLIRRDMFSFDFEEINTMIYNSYYDCYCYIIDELKTYFK